jgi:predicted ATP-grasp superfamily ATP-dependent carboligase
VTGGEYPAGLAAVRALEAAGFEVWAAVQSRDCLAARSRAPAGLIDVPSPRTHPEAWVAALAEGARRIGAAAVLPGTEAALLALADRDGSFPEGVALGTADSATVRRATDKGWLGLLSMRSGLEVPPTLLLDADGTLATAQPAYPALVKPIRSELMSGGQLKRFDAAYVENPAELERALRALPDNVAFVQPYIEGRLISFNGVAFKGELHGANQHVVYRVWPYRCGQAVYAETIAMDQDRERAVAHFMKELGWSGVFNLQLIEYDGRDYVIDLNPRFYVSLTLAAAAGMNLPAIWTRLLLGLPVEIPDYRTGVRFRQEKGDPRALLAELRRGHFEHLHGALPHSHTVHALFSRSDPRPGLTIATDALAALRRRVR